jgi:hypothetical protein
MSLVTTALSSAFSLAGLPRTFAVYGIAVAAVVARRIARKIVQYIAIAVLFAIGLSFLTAGLFLWLMHELGPVYASLIVGGGFVVVGLVAFLATRSQR